MKKNCIKCNIDKDIKEFSVRNKETGALFNKCDECRREYRREYYEKNKRRFNKHVKDPGKNSRKKTTTQTKPTPKSTRKYIKPLSKRIRQRLALLTASLMMALYMIEPTTVFQTNTILVYVFNLFSQTLVNMFFLWNIKSYIIGVKGK